MSRRRREKAAAAPCPCGLGPFATCCGPVLAGTEAAATPERLMRSRYTAYARGDLAHLRASWHPSTLPEDLRLDPDTRWTGLEVLETSGGSLLESTGTVRFRAHWAHGPRTGAVDEHSRFVREGGRWLYVEVV